MQTLGSLMTAKLRVIRGALQGFLMDVTAQHEAQQAVDEATQRFKSIAQATNDGIWDWDLRTNTSWWSNGIQTLFGLSPDEMTTGITSWTDFIHPEDKEEVLAALHEALVSKRTDWSAEYRFQRKDGSYAEVLDRAQIFRDESGIAIRMVGGVSDLTERRQSELRLAQLNRIEQATMKIAAGVSASTGAAFFEQLARSMAQATAADGAFIARFHDSQMHLAETVTAVVDGRIVPNFKYAISGSPSEKLVTGTDCIVLDNVTHCFPSSGAAKMGMQSYVGCRLDNAAGQPLGLLFVLFQETVPQPEFVAQTIQIFAARAASELERRLADARIREQASLLDKAKDAIVVHDLSNRITFWNKGAERLYGWTGEEALGASIATLAYGDEQHQRITTSLSERDEWQGEVTCRHRNGIQMVVEINATLVRDADDNPGSVLSIITDIRQRKEAEHDLNYLAFHDRVTGLSNRHAFTRSLKSLLDGDSSEGNKGALLWIDLDGLKSLNDTQGHDVGDLLLRQVGARIAESIDSDDIAARFGGDEFVVLTVDLNDDDARARLVGERLLQRLSEPFDLDGYVHRGSASIGLTYFRCDRDAAAEILKRADLAMYEAKAAGRNSLQLFDARMQQLMDARVKLEEDLRCALLQGQLHLLYQPQVAESGQVIGAEALLRWNHQMRGLVSPAEFIPLAETTGLIISIGQWVLEQACMQLKQWENDPTCRLLTISVNVSVQQIRHHAFVDQVLQTVRNTGIDPHKLKLELTESTLVTDADATVAKMTTLKEVGIQFSLDDFGTGYSSLSYLKRLPLDQLKIDRSFVIDVMTDQNAAVIARSVVALGQSLGLEVIAEGVETQAQRQFLAAHGCTAYQGYLFSRPLTDHALKYYLMSMQGRHANEALS